MIIYVDIDETICTQASVGPSTSPDYSRSVPILENISKMNSLYESGHTIIYWTARGSKTGLDWEELTKQQLKKWGVLNHGISLGKPYYDLFICDKAINSREFFFLEENKGE
jgi:hypothetical protein